MRFLVLLFAFFGGERLQADHAPTPFTAAQIRAGCPDGRVSTFLIEPKGGEKMKMVMRFARGDAEGVDVEQEYAGGQLKVGRAPWISLQRHGSFPEADTKITEETIEVPVGKFACKVYEVKRGSEVTRFCFATAIPGPPVKMVSKTIAMTLIEHRPFDYAKYFGPQEVVAGIDKDLAKQCAISAKVVKGVELLRMDSQTATVFGGNARAGVIRLIDPGTWYVMAHLKGPPATCTVRVTKGLLRGALIPLGVYPLPAGVPVPKGKVAFEIVALK